MVLAALAAALALVAGYARRAVVDSDQFANRATAALEAPAVRALISARVADEVLAQEPDLIAVRPLIESVAGGVVGGGAFTGVFRSAVRDVHRALIDRDQDTLTLTLRDIGVVLAGALQAVRPELADELRRADDVSPAHARRRPRRRRPGPGGRSHPAAGVAAARRGRGVRRRGAGALAATAARRPSRSAARVAVAGIVLVRRLRGRPLLGGRLGPGHAGARRRGGGVGRVPRRPARRGVGPRRLAAPSSRPRRRRCCGRSTWRRSRAAPRAPRRRARAAGLRVLRAVALRGDRAGAPARPRRRARARPRRSRACC